MLRNKPALPHQGEALAALSRPVAGVHDRWRPPSPRLVGRVFANEPFEDYPRAVARSRQLTGRFWPFRGRSRDVVSGHPEAFLRSLFPPLQEIPGISFTAEGDFPPREEAAVRSASDRYLQAGLSGQARQLQEAYDGLRALRQVFRFRTATAGGRGRKGISLTETAVPARYLPELLVAAPVWFVEAKRSAYLSCGGLHSETIFYDLCPTAAFADLFQLYNYFHRPFERFSGHDPMPLELAGLVRDLKNLFDCLVIATPYHDLAAAEWGEASWPPGIDPFLFGFLRQVPDYMFFLGRWSGTGLFPLIPEMMAATVLHLRAHRHLLATARIGQLSWYRPGAAAGRGAKASSLVRFADQVLRHFTAGTLFPWLRGETG